MLDASRLRSILHYNPETGVMVWLKPSPYHAEKAGQLAGSPTPSGCGKAYVNISIDGKKHKRSRLAWLYMTGEQPSLQIDHINGDSLDDRWSNLRQATATQNAWNHHKRAKRSDLPMGVRVNASSGRFAARIAVNKAMMSLGTFDTPQEAAAAYQEARERFYGDFA